MTSLDVPMSIRTRWLPLALVAAVTACGQSPAEPDPPGTSKNLGDLVVLELPGTAPALFSDSVAFYAKRNRKSEAAIYFRTSSGQQGEKFAELKLEDATLLARPDGTPFGLDDSVRIVMRAVPGKFMVELSPSGLKFSSTDPARLKLKYDEADDDFDDDGDDDADDDATERKLSIWRQENLGDPFVKIGTVKVEGVRELEARLTSFSRYAIAY